MKCAYCGDPAGLFRRLCGACKRMAGVFKTLPPSYGTRELLDLLFETGISNEKIERFLNADIDGRGSIRDYMTARMTNEVMASLGQPSHMKGTDVKKVREQIAEGKPPSLTDQEVTDYSQLPHKK